MHLYVCMYVCIYLLIYAYEVLIDKYQVLSIILYFWLPALKKKRSHVASLIQILILDWNWLLFTY